ncbi:ribonuclease 1-like [Pyrus ussuriensis x Pyrus communis]|uniref:Ribonuclease 1-like n=1 Tax=Pyrus ussuriensis x Pyrus communis TaxID=2448454 RepID=A0A5N5I322_9ROSA|nr:ribonuclease 1-like [Pyrus ussuriensis x Pyrus communis]
MAKNAESFLSLLSWPGSYCGAAKQGCCYPKTGKPTKDFKIGGIWPLSFTGEMPTNCESNTHFRLSVISNLTKSLENEWPSLSCPISGSSKLWEQEWTKYGTCSKPLFGGQYHYFHAALNLRNKVNILKMLSSAGIHPNGSFYSLRKIVDAIQSRVTYMPAIMCNEDKSGNKQLYQILLCGDTTGTKIVDCLGLPRSNCSEKIKFPSF